ncbi:MAG: serine protease [Chitinophagaceae bacterium]|nr:serine protease [Chitinophagaceae bacterium]
MRNIKIATTIYFLIFVLACLNTASLFAQKKIERQDSWYEQLQAGTVSIGCLDSIKGRLSNKWFKYYNIIGTGVIFYVKDKLGVLPVLVTAKHVIQDSNNNFIDSIRIRFSNDDDLSVFDFWGYRITLKDKKSINFFMLPDSTIDLVAIPLIFDSKPSVNFSVPAAVPYRYFPTKNYYYEGADIIVLGYPGAVGFNYWTRALLRKGIISWVPKTELAKRKFLIDCNVFPGNSGGPVFSIPNYITTDTTLGGEVKFLGIVVERRFNKNKVYQSKSNIPFRDSAGTEILSLESIGVGVVEPAENILKLLEELEKVMNK